MKQITIALFLLFAIVPVNAQQPKRVFITLDASTSMEGNKYALANYTAQMIISLCDSKDEISMIVTGQKNDLTKGRNPLVKLQYPFHNFPFVGNNRDEEFQDIIAFDRLYRPVKGKQDWLFIIGDGEWSTQDSAYSKGRSDFQDIVKGGTVNVCYLQAGVSVSAESDFTSFVKGLGVVDIRKSDLKPNTIKAECDHFARKILGFSDVPLSVKDSGNQRVSVTPELPVKGFYLVYQDETFPEDLPGIQQVLSGASTFQVDIKGTPTTIPLKDQNADVDLSGNVWLIMCDDIVPANSSIEVCFDKNVRISNISIFPLIADVSFGTVSLSGSGGQLKQLDSHTYTICRNESKARVRIELSEETADNLPDPLLKRTEVVVKANNKNYKAHYRNGGFECEIDLLEEETLYYAECDCPGYFKRVTPIATIVKGDCEPRTYSVDERPAMDLGQVAFEQLKSDNITLTLHDSATEALLDPDLFDIDFDIESRYLFDDPKVEVENGTIVLVLHPKGEWCECLFPTKLNIKMVSTPKDGAFEEYGKNYTQTVFPLYLEIVKTLSWFSRCLWVIVSILALLILFFYLRALRRKNRFKKNACMVPTYYNFRGEKVDQGGSDLRKKGFAAWFARWFLPGDEHITLSFNSPDVSLKFVAADSNEVVNIPKEGNIIPETMRIAGYNPKKDTEPKQPVKLSDRGRITILKDDETEDGYLTFSSGTAKDGAGYRFVIGLLMVAALIAIVVLLYLMFRSAF